MMWLFIILGILVGVIIFLLLTPLVVYIDTKENKYAVNWTAIAGIKVIPDVQEILYLRYRILFFYGTYYPLKTGYKKKKEEKEQKAKKKNRIKRIPTRMLNVLRSFYIQKLRIDVDPFNYFHIAYLFPASYFLSGENRTLNINFQGKNSLQIIIYNRLVNILYAFLK